MKIPESRGAFTLVELLVTTAVIGAVGLVLYSLLNINLILEAKNIAINTTHQQARVAMLDMLQDLRSSISAPVLANSAGTAYSTTPASGYAEGIAFQKWAVDAQGVPMGPFKIYSDAPKTQNYIQIAVPTGSTAPSVGQGLIIPTHQIEADIKTVASATGAPSGFTGYRITLYNFRDGTTITPSNNNNLPVAIAGTGSTLGDIVCFITDRCSYAVTNNALNLNYRGNSYSKTTGSRITNSTPFSVPTAAVGAAFSLSASDVKYNNRGYKSTNILLNRQVPIKAQLTTYQ